LGYCAAIIKFAAPLRQIRFESAIGAEIIAVAEIVPAFATSDFRGVVYLIIHTAHLVPPYFFFFFFHFLL
jgi:hypothetical protein